MRTTGSVIQQTSIDDLTERISFLYHETARNLRGDIVKGAGVIRCVVWAKVLPLTGRINDTTPERINSVTYRFVIRYRTDIKSDDLIIWRGRKFQPITPPIDAENRHIWTIIESRELVRDGEEV